MTYLLPLRAFFSHTREAGQQPCLLQWMAVDKPRALYYIPQRPPVEDDLQLKVESIPSSPPDNRQTWLSYILPDYAGQATSSRAHGTIHIFGS